MPVPLSRISAAAYVRPATTATPAVRATSSGGCCPACGGLECLCRPRFFAGQLLTDQDLNRLDQYIVAKQRHHNRYLHGWGVVCGLEVLCHPCDGYVTVTVGYALSPCGEDIIVCANDAVNICELLDRCGQRDRLDECDPLRPFQTDDCRDAVEDWVLVVCYEERPTRGQMLIRQSAESARCNRCGSSGGCNGNCGGGCQDAAAPAPRRTSVVTTPGQCEPTVLCETYHFELRKRQPAKVTDRRKTVLGGPAQRFQECVQILVDALPPPPTLDGSTKEDWFRWCCDLKAAILEVLAQRGVLDCTIADRLALLRCPDPSKFEGLNDYLPAVIEEVRKLVIVAAEWVRACLCSALLPPCPDPAMDSCVPLARLRIRRADCTVLSVCNVTERKQVISAPMIEYYLAATPLAAQIRLFLERICCGDVAQRDVGFSTFNRAAAVNNQGQWTQSFARAKVDPATASAFGSAAGAAFQRTAAEVSPYMFLLDALGAVNPNGEALMADAERELPFDALLLNQLVQPVFKEFAPVRAATAAKPVDVDTNAEVHALRAQLDQQQETLAAMRKELDALRGAAPNR